MVTGHFFVMPQERGCRNEVEVSAKCLRVPAFLSAEADAASKPEWAGLIPQRLLARRGPHSSADEANLYLISQC
jgi:hypothetical protein